MISIFGLTKILNLIIMNANPNLKVVHRLLIEKPHHDPAFEDTELHVLHSKESVDIQDNYDYYPDFGI